MLDFIQERRYILYGVFAVLALGLVGLLLYRFFSPGTPRTSEEEPIENVGGGISTSTSNGGPGTDGSISTSTPPGSGPEKEKKLTQVTDFPIIGPALNKTENKILYYKKEAGHAFSSTIKGDAREEISNTTILGIIEAFWSPSRDRAIISYLADDQETLKSLLQIGSSTALALPSNLKGVSWAPSGKSAVYLLPKDKRLYLTTITAAGKTPRTLYRTSIPDAQIAWVGASSIAIQSAPSGVAQGSLFVFSTAYKTLRKVVGPLYGLMSRWSPDAKTIAVSFTDSAGKRLALSFYSSGGKELFKTGLQTLAEKCIFSADSKFAYCAIPRIISSGAVFPDEYLRGELNTADRIVLVNIAKKTVSEVFDEGNYDMSDLLVTKARDYLFFVNRGDGTLWRLKLN